MLEYVLKVMVNGKNIARTNASKLNPDFSFDVNEVIHLSLLKFPESASINIYEKGLGGDLVATIYFGVPGVEGSSSSDAKKYDELLFTSASSFLPIWLRELKSGIFRCPPYFDRAAENRAEEEAKAKAAGFLQAEGVSAVRANSANPFFHVSRFHSSGHLFLKSFWSSLEEGQPAQAPPPPSNSQAGLSSNRDHQFNALTAKDLLNIQRIKEWMKGKSIDPNDPRNTGLVSMLQLVDQVNLTRSGFYLSEQDEEVHLDSADPGSIKENKRLKLLQMRDQRLIEFNEPVPLDEFDVTDKMLRRIPNASGVGDHGEGPDTPYSYSQLSQYQKQVRKQMIALQSSRRAIARKKQPKLSHVIKNESPLPDFSRLWSWISDFFSPARPLLPKRVEQSKRSETGKIESCRIFVQIVRGYNIPTRRDAEDSEEVSFRSYRASRMKLEEMKQIEKRRRTRRFEGETGEAATGEATREELESAEQEAKTATMIAKQNQNSVYSFAQITFQKNQESIRPIAGPNPQFNENVCFDFVAPGGDFSPENLKLVQDKIFIDVFDELTIANVKDDRNYNTISERIEVRWLGSFSVPFSTLYMHGKIEGVFPLKTPIMNLGYEQSQQKPSIEVYMLIEPPLPLPDPEEDFLSSGETPEMFSYAKWWENTTRGYKNCADRNIMALAPNVEGRATLVMRYICKQNPPQELDSIGQAVRFVSLIPFIDDSTAFQGRTKVWSDSQEFLDIPAGDAEEHAILLCNYFLYLGKKAYVVLGKGIPEGLTAYVLTRDGVAGGSPNTFTFTLWNASTGDSFSTTDPFCPLHQVGMVFDNENIWANIQKESQPSKMSFRLEDAWCWRPFFGKGSWVSKTAPIQTIQPEKLVYRKTLDTFANKVQRDLERKLKLEFVSWRESIGRSPFTWHFGCQSILHQLAQKFEQDKQGINALSEQEHNDKLGMILATYEMNGFPMNFSFTDFEPIIQELYNTDIHNNAEPGVTFALDVFVEKFPNNVLSVWVYVACLLSKR